MKDEKDEQIHVADKDSLRKIIKISTKNSFLIALTLLGGGTLATAFIHTTSKNHAEPTPIVQPVQTASEWGWISPLKIWAMCGTHPDKPYDHTSSTCGLGDDVRLSPLDLTAHLDGYLFEGPPSGTIKTRFPMPQKP